MEQFHQYLENVVIRFVDIGQQLLTITVLNSDGQQFHQYWWNWITTTSKSDGQQFHQYEQNELQPPLRVMVNNSTNIGGIELQSPLNSDGQQFHQYWWKRITTCSKQWL